ncbi:hypothetical protein RRG08_022892 [Elysia crispata]|uniref:Uncharacterized protein n=1 Tax=Elysia crispata TaxID=231223 RepID=A0AAE0XN32_9GAST|nr:hypothetical protein RRG08_022892 [Elysia crispata]
MWVEIENYTRRAGALLKLSVFLGILMITPYIMVDQGALYTLDTIVGSCENAHQHGGVDQNAPASKRGGVIMR